MNWREGESNPKILQHYDALFSSVSTSRPQRRSENRTYERKMSHLNIAFDRYASTGTIMHYILVISVRYSKSKLELNSKKVELD